MSISSGADDGDDGDYDKKKKGGSTAGRFGGFGVPSVGGGGGGGKKKFSSGGGGGGGSPSFRRSSAAYSGGGGSTSSSLSGALILLAITIAILLSGTTFYYRKMTTRAKLELTTLKAQARHPHEHHHDQVNNKDNRAHAEAVANLKKQQSELQVELTKATAHNKDMEDEIVKTHHIANALEEEMKAYNQQYDSMSRSWNDLSIQVKETRQQFIDSHDNTHHEDATTGGIVPGGPGHTLNQKRELEEMESIDDYENFVERREDALWDKIDLLIEKIGRDSKREALEWFGADLLYHRVPEDEISFRVDFEVEYPKFDPHRADDNPEIWTRVKETITIEMAPLKLMPIAVNLFLQQVHHGLWEGCNFVINAMHILQAGPHLYRGEGKFAANAYQLKSKFEKSRLDVMPYQEYSDDYPHSKYTVGFAGRPGGPDFYINKVDNSENHGPGGQTHHDLHEEADPCFGHVVAGFEVIEDISRIPVDREKGSLLLAPVTIVSGRVIALRRNEMNNHINDDGTTRDGGRGGVPPSGGGQQESLNVPTS